MRKLAGDVWGRIALCLLLLGLFAIPSVARRLEASGVDHSGRIAAGAAFTCAIKSDDTVWCWGRNDQGQLGSSDHAGLMESLLPVRAGVFGYGAVAAPTKVVAGTEHACVLTSAGSVWCWGFNGAGQVGINGSTQWDPVQVNVGGTVTQIAAGGANTCAVLADSSVRCWGQNIFGQLGIGSTDTNAHYTPETVQGIPASFTVSSLDIGTGHVCASSTAGEAWCWGRFMHGRLGTTASSNVTSATRTATLSGVASHVSAGADHTCVVVGAGVMCFGRNHLGQSGQPNNTTTFSTPTAVTMSGTASRVSAGDAFTCILLNTGAVQCFGSNAAGQLGRGNAVSLDAVPASVQGLSSGAVTISSGASHACAIAPAGEVLCWGLNDYGQLGDNSQTDSNLPVVVPFFSALPTTTTTIATTTSVATTTTIAATTTTPAVATTVAPTTTLATTTTVEVNAPPVVTATSQPTNTALSLASVGVTKLVKIRRLRSITAAKIASAVSLKIPKRSQGSMRISITRGTKHCRFVGSTVRGIKKGTCTVTVVLLPKKGKPTVKTLKIQVR